MFRVAICDDNYTFLDYEKKLIDAYLKNRNVDCVCDSYLSGNGIVQVGTEINKYNLIILDYEMDGLTGFETARKIYELYPDAVIAFATNFYDFTREGYKYRAIRYLVKQEKSFESDLYECLDYTLNFKIDNKTILLELYDSTVLPVKVDDIVYVKSDNHYIRYYIKGKDTDADHLIKRSSIDAACEDLPDSFIRIHQRYVVNLKNAMRIQNNKIDMNVGNGEIISLPIARSRSNMVFRKFCLLKGSN